MANGDEAGAYSASFRCRVCRVDYRVTDIEDLLTRPEGKRLEYKRDLSLPGPAMRALTAFANSAGGGLVFGVEDDHTIRGVEDPIALESRLINLISDRIAPRIVPEIDIVPWRSTQLVVVQVHLSPSRPHRLVATVRSMFDWGRPIGGLTRS